MFEAVTSSPFFGLALTLGCWCLGVELQRRTGLLICNPVLVASLLVIGALTVLRRPPGVLQCRRRAGKADAGPGHRGAGPEYLSTAAGAAGTLSPRVGRVSGGQRRQHGLRAAAVPAVPRRGDACCSMLPKSVTTAIALGISESGGGIPGITAAPWSSREWKEPCWPLCLPDASASPTRWRRG